MKRRLTCFVLASMWLALSGCSRHIVLQTIDSPGEGPPYECMESGCEPAKEFPDYNQSGTTLLPLPWQCKSHGIGRVLILNAGSRTPKVTATCAAPDEPIGEMK